VVEDVNGAVAFPHVDREAVGGARVGLAIRGLEADALGRGTVLAPAGNMRVVKPGESLDLHVSVPKFYAHGIQADDVFHAGFGLQVVPVRVAEGSSIAAGSEGTITVRPESALATLTADPVLLWDLDNAPLRFAGGGRVA
jgi:selenocysteine-specific translation elongation factor